MVTNQKIEPVPFFELGYYGQAQDENGEKFLVKIGVPINKNLSFPCSGSEYVSEEDLKNEHKN